MATEIKRIQLRRDTIANWTTANPILAEGEYGYETDTGYERIGDGSTAFLSLPIRIGALNGKISLDSVSFDTGAAYAVGEGEMAWNAGDNTLDVGLSDGTVLQMGQEMHIHAKAAEALTDADVVYASGAVGASGKIEVSKFIADNSVDEIYMLGVVTHDIVSGSFGYVTTFGAVRGVPTDGAAESETWIDGTVLYASPTVAGQLTNVIPVAPNQAISVAMVIVSHATNGTLYVRPSRGLHIGELHDVHAPAPSEGDILKWATDRWVNSTPTASDLVSDTTPQLGGPLDTNAFQVRWSKGADVASASALTLGEDGNIFDITGTTAITSIGTLGVGTTVMLRATAALPLTHHATDLILLGGVSVTLAAGDWVIFTENAVGKWTMISANFPIASFTDATTGTQNTKYMTALRTKQAIAEFSAPVQIVTSADGAVATGTTLIPGDDTIPQNTEGDEYLSVTITPKSATNLLIVSLETNFAHAVLGTISVALFKNAAADAIAVFGLTGEAADRRSVISLTHALVAGGTSAITFKVRAGGSNAGTITLNGTSGARKYGGKSASHITVTEYFAS